MHSSRMLTARSSSRHGGSPHSPRPGIPPGAGTPTHCSRHPPAAGTLWSRHPPGVGLESPPPHSVGLNPPTSQMSQLPPLGVGLETGKACWDTIPPETCCKACWDTTALNRITDTCKNITLPQLRCGR